MCQLEKPKERRRKLAWAHAYAYDVEGKLHGVVVETSDSSDDDDDDVYATPPLKVSESESDTKDDTGEKKQLDNSPSLEWGCLAEQINFARFRPKT